MKSSAVLWIVALVLTLAFSVWQRVSGPTYPIYGHSDLGGHPMNWVLKRTQAGPGDHTVRIPVGTAGPEGTIEWRDHGTDGAWTTVTMRQDGLALAGEIPHHAPGQKVDYRVTLRAGDATAVLPAQGVATIRFRNDVPWWVLIPHIVAIMGALLLSTRAALESLAGGPRLKEFTLRTLGALFVGGFLLGCMVSGYAFGQPWGGFPLGNDPTDNKTLVAFLGWAVAAVMVFRTRASRPWVFAAAVLMLVVYGIPHSVAMPK